MHAPPSRAVALGPFALNWQRFIDLGYSPVPLFPCNTIKDGKLRDKSPSFLGWSPKLRERVITREEAERRLSTLPNAEIGAVCAFNRLTGVDIDTLDRELQEIILAVLPPAPTRIGNPAKAGLLLYQWGGDGDPVTKRFADRNGEMIVEILGAGAQFVMPPSAHPNGTVYRMSTGDIPLVAELPILLQEHLDALAAAIAPYRKTPHLFDINSRPRQPVGRICAVGRHLHRRQHSGAAKPLLVGPSALRR